MVNNPPAVPEIQEMRVGSLGQENPLEKEKAAHSTIPAGITPVAKGAWQDTVRGVTQTVTWSHMDMTQ